MQRAHHNYICITYIDMLERTRHLASCISRYWEEAWNIILKWKFEIVNEFPQKVALLGNIKYPDYFPIQ